MSNVLAMPGAWNTQLGKPNEFVIRSLERLLEQARSGELQTLVVAGALADGGVVTVISDDQDMVSQQLGALSIAQHKLLSKLF